MKSTLTGKTHHLVFVKDDTTDTGFACHGAGAFPFDQAVKLVRLRPESAFPCGSISRSV
jgi:hypothetical protein